MVLVKLIGIEIGIWEGFGIGNGIYKKVREKIFYRKVEETGLRLLATGIRYELQLIVETGL